MMPLSPPTGTVLQSEQLVRPVGLYQYLQPDPLWRAGLSDRDRRILALTGRKLGGSATDFTDALRALREAVEEVIPAGRTFLIGTTGEGPIVGSIISGVGIVAGATGVRVVRLDRHGLCTPLGGLCS